MNILNISKSDKNVTVSLTSDELQMLCNLMSERPDIVKDQFHQLHSELLIANNLCQCGHLDNFALTQIVKAKNRTNDYLAGILPQKDIDTFNAYLTESRTPDMCVAFGNSDWNEIYRKIVGPTGANKVITNWQNQNTDSE